MFSLKKKVAVVTGGASGIGAATALRIANAGAKVVIGDMSDAGSVAEEVGGVYQKTDVSNEQQVEALMEKAVQEYGRLDILVHCAGIFHKNAGIEQETTENYQRHFSINTMGVAYGIKHAAARMTEGGSIVAVAALAGLRGNPNTAAYSVSKISVIGLIKVAAVELGPKGIRVNCISPGTTRTPMGWLQSPWPFRITQLGRVGEPEEMAAAIHFLAADDCGFITGQDIIIDGGVQAGPSIALIDTVNQSETKT